MSQGNPSCLRFSLEESVWFQKGQEVSELLSISLDPDILIQENDQYVTIQGALELSGEYKRYETDGFEEENNFIAPKFIQVVEERDEGVCEFTHFFPVDITIPYNRIQSIHEIDVSVESFDYVFPERSCLKLTANLTISGIYGEQQHTHATVKADSEYEPTYRSPAKAETDLNLTSEEVEEDHTDEEQENEIYTEFEAEARKQASLFDDKEEITTRASKEDENKEEKVKKMLEVSFKDNRSEHLPPSAQEIYKMPKTEESSLVESKVVESSSEQEFGGMEESSDYELKETILEKEEVLEKKKKKLLSKKKSMSLTEFFARKTEENIAKLKVCIVQNGDTVHMIAEKYDIPVHRLLSVNHLEINQDIYEGQVLYIPVAVAQK
ncbi:stage VI sporulation protein D [Cytobacillus depressus]|uniref:Stage VI sporulation protein D n=1 Tax=Cytobacillus depressus TaxID=1602942 RepID=A0A6L3VH20_9BACI|nr:stage VI sporulation protein D [Cytobacillus depressus]KAB2338734.1 stage VI sporulation protein D [Cytobacillus depressus]